MGNAQVHDPTPVLDENRRELNLSRKLTHKQYTKHLQGDHSESCLIELPWQVRDSVSLYERMDVSFNALLEIPSELPLRLPHLNYINLNHNCIVTLPDSFGLFFHLKTLLLSYNKISTLPKSFCHLSKLDKLDLSHNCIRELPEDFGQLQTLRRLNVSENKLKYLPKTFGASLEVIIAHSNRLIDPPQCFANEGSEALIEYMKKGWSQGDVHCQTAVNVFARVCNNQQLTTGYNPTPDQALYVQQRTHEVNISTYNRVKTPLLPPPDSSSLERIEVRDKILGLIYGAAIGDAIGIATKGLGPDECDFHYDFDRLTYGDIVRDKQRARWKTGDWTTNFDQFVLVLDCLLNWAGVVDELDFAERLLHWFTHGFPELGDHEGFEPNSTIAEVVASDGYVQDPHGVAEALLEDAARTRSVNSADDLHANSSGIMRRIFGLVDAKYADNGALARCLILGVIHYHSLTEVTDNTIRVCKATHADPRCLASAVVLTNVIALMMRGKYDSDKPDETLTQLVKKSCDAAVAAFLSNNDTHAKEFMGSCNKPDFESIDAREESKTSYVLKTLSCALIGLQKSDDFRTIITDVIKLGGNSSTNACVTGAMVGCKLGFSKLPSDWLHGLRKKQMDWLNLKVNFLLDMMGSP